MVKLTRDFRPAELWTFPKVLLDKFELMSNSGGSWGADLAASSTRRSILSHTSWYEPATVTTPPCWQG